VLKFIFTEKGSLLSFSLAVPWNARHIA